MSAQNLNGRHAETLCGATTAATQPAAWACYVRASRVSTGLIGGETLLAAPDQVTETHSSPSFPWPAAVRLVNGSPRNTRAMQGRLEIQLQNGSWSTVCDDEFNDVAATVVCRQVVWASFGRADCKAFPSVATFAMTTTSLVLYRCSWD